MNFYDLNYFVGFYLAVILFPFAIPALHLAMRLVTVLPRAIRRTDEPAPAYAPRAHAVVTADA